MPQHIRASQAFYMKVAVTKQMSRVGFGEEFVSPFLGKCHSHIKIQCCGAP